MRNLKKILALVLALVMSLSLVTTAGAFSDDGDVNESYNDAIAVLSGLNVFKGYSDGSFQPKGNITRAEVAAIIYRIVTGDVTDAQASIHSTWGMFTDVADGAWYAGYVNYCANAQYIKGRGNKIFDPQATVTGYEALAMILRAVGYDKNGEFTGSNWQVRTASTANERGVLKNVTEGLLGQSASRELVAELLFRSIVIPRVNFNTNTLSYTERPLNADGKKDTLGYEKLKLEEITGVVVANEYADLESGDTLADGRTRMVVDGADKTVYNLEYSSTLDDIGESRSAYIQNGNLSKVLLLADSGKNVVYEDGVKKNAKDAAKDKGLKLNDTTEYYRNFDPMVKYEAKWRIEYKYAWTSTRYAALLLIKNNGGTVTLNDVDILKGTNIDDALKAAAENNTGMTEVNEYVYTKVIPAGDTLNSTDRGFIKQIFRAADREYGTTGGIDIIRGEVYVGTSSLTGNVSRNEDVSDVMSHDEFYKTYVNTIDNADDIGENKLGYRLKVVDNDDDTIADYVMQTVYTVTKVESVGTESKYTFKTANEAMANPDSVNEIGKDIKTKVWTGDSLSAGDVVLYAKIDGKANAWLAESATSQISKINRVDKKVTTSDGTEYADSSVNVYPKADSQRSIGLGDDVANMLNNTTYSLYFDLFGNLAAFNEADEQFVLLVDGWHNETKGGVEYAVKAWLDGSIQTKDVDSSGELFINELDGLNNTWGQIKALGDTTGRLNNDNDRTYTDKDGNVYDTTSDFSIRTSVALLSDNGVLTPVDLAYNTIKKNAMIATEGDKIPTDKGVAGKVYNTVGRTYDGTRRAYNSEETVDTYDVRALSTTKYLFVYNVYNAAYDPDDTLSDRYGRNISTVVKEYVGYGNLPKEDTYEAFVEDVYVVGTEEKSATNVTYYTADMVVIELNSNYYRNLGGEIVFIPRYPSHTTGIEGVYMIRGNGVYEEVDVNLTRSGMREYAEYAEMGAKKMTTGLYRMWKDTTENVYYVRPIEKIEDAGTNFGFAIGVVDKAYGTIGADYAVLDTFKKATVATDGTDKVEIYGKAGSEEAKNTANSKYYILKNGTELEIDQTPDTVLAQTLYYERGYNTGVNQKTDSCLSTWNETRFQSWNEQLNEVLVVYENPGSNKIAYAIAFKEYDGDLNDILKNTHNDAQKVWGSYLPDAGLAYNTVGIDGKWTTYTSNLSEYYRAAYAAIQKAVAALKMADTDAGKTAALNEALADLAKVQNIIDYPDWEYVSAAVKAQVALMEKEVNDALGKKKTYTVTVVDADGNVLKSGTVVEGADANITITIPDGKTATVDVGTVDNATGVITVTNVTKNETVTVTFADKTADPVVTVKFVTVDADDVETEVPAAEGLKYTAPVTTAEDGTKSAVVTLTTPGYNVVSVKSGETVADGKFTVENVTADVEKTVVVEKINDNLNGAVTVSAMSFNPVDGSKVHGPDDIQAEIVNGALVVTNAQIDTAMWSLADFKPIAVFCDRAENNEFVGNEDATVWTLDGFTTDDAITIGVVMSNNPEADYKEPVFPGAARRARTEISKIRSIQTIPADVAPENAKFVDGSDNLVTACPAANQAGVGAAAEGFQKVRFVFEMAVADTTEFFLAGVHFDKNGSGEDPIPPTEDNVVKASRVTVAGSLDKYTFYSYVQPHEVTIEEAKKAILETEKQDDTTGPKGPERVEINETTGRATVYYRNSDPVTYNLETSGILDSMLHPGELYQVKYNGDVVGYAGKNIPVYVETAYETGVLAQEGLVELGAGTAGCPVTSGKATVSGITRDVSYVDGILLKAFNGTCGAKYNDINGIERKWTYSATSTVVCVPVGTTIKVIADSTYNEKGKKYSLTLDGKTVGDAIPGTGVATNLPEHPVTVGEEYVGKESVEVKLGTGVDVHLNGKSIGIQADTTKVPVGLDKDEILILTTDATTTDRKQYWQDVDTTDASSLIASKAVKVGEGGLVDLTGLSANKDGIYDLWRAAIVDVDNVDFSTAEMTVTVGATEEKPIDTVTNVLYVAETAVITYKASAAKKYITLSIASDDPYKESTYKVVGTLANEAAIAETKITIGETVPVGGTITVDEVTRAGVVKLTLDALTLGSYGVTSLTGLASNRWDVNDSAADGTNLLGSNTTIAATDYAIYKSGNDGLVKDSADGFEAGKKYELVVKGITVDGGELDPFDSTALTATLKDITGIKNVVVTVTGGSDLLVEDVKNVKYDEKTGKLDMTVVFVAPNS